MTVNCEIMLNKKSIPPTVNGFKIDANLLAKK